MLIYIHRGRAVTNDVRTCAWLLALQICNKCDQTIYIQTSTVLINLSRVYIGLILPVSIYMCTIRLIELTVAWQNSKPVSSKMHAFLQNAISVALLYSGFVWTNIKASYIQKFSRIGKARVTFFFARYKHWETRLRADTDTTALY